MLGPGRYLLGVLELALLVGFAGLGAARVRRRLLPELRGAPAHLAMAVIALALLIWVAEVLGTVSLFEPVPYLLAVVVVGLGLWFAVRDASPTLPASDVGEALRTAPQGTEAGARSGGAVATALARSVAAIAVVHFLAGVKARLSTGMTGFDSTWYHGPFAAGFLQSGDTWSLHFIAPQFLAWFYPANAEIFHAAGMLAFGRDLLSPWLNLGWFLGCLGAAWCVGRPYRVAPWSLALAAVALSVPALHDQAGEARNDLAGTFFLLAGVAVALNAWRGERASNLGLSTGALLVIGLAGGLAGGTKLNFLLPATVLVFALVALAPRGRRWHALLCAGLAALAGGGYWYLRNLVHAGSPLPWIHHVGPITLPAPEQGLGGREAHSVLDYVTDGGVWSDWFFPGLHHGLWLLWPLLALAAAAGLGLALAAPVLQRRWASNDTMGHVSGPSSALGLVVAGAVGVAVFVAWVVSPTSASGPEGVPRGFESGLRYLAPALVLGLALLPAAAQVWALARSISFRTQFPPHSAKNRVRSGERWVWAALAGVVLVAVVLGYPIQRHYLKERYANPTFTTPGLDAAFKWARNVEDARIATTSTRQYPLFGTDLSNRVAYVGVHRPHGGFEEIESCPQWRRALDAGGYDYVLATYDRIESGNPPFPPQARWTEGPGAEVVLKRSPTAVFKLTAPLDPAACGR